jgi:hypothetical protein
LVAPPSEAAKTDAGFVSEDAVKLHLKNWLEAQGWRVTVAWKKERGIDIEAFKESSRWIIEAKGTGSLAPMRVNYFQSILGETTTHGRSERKVQHCAP